MVDDDGARVLPRRAGSTPSACSPTASTSSTPWRHEPGPRYALHLCRGNRDGHWMAAGGYEAISRAVFERATAFDAYFLEYDDERSGGFEPLGDVPDDKAVVLGLVSTKRAELEDPGELLARIDEAAQALPARAARAVAAVRLRLHDRRQPRAGRDVRARSSASSPTSPRRPGADVGARAARRRRAAARAVGARRAVRARVGDEHPARHGRARRARHPARRERVLGRGRADARGLGARPRHRHRARHPARAADRLEPLDLPSAARADRVPAPDPVRGADPARGADLRPGPREQGLPRRVRVVLADADPDHLRRPGRRPGGDRHGALVRARAARADVADHRAERRAVHRDRHPHLLRRRADPGRDRRAA